MFYPIHIGRHSSVDSRWIGEATEATYGCDSNHRVHAVRLIDLNLNTRIDLNIFW